MADLHSRTGPATSPAVDDVLVVDGASSSEGSRGARSSVADTLSGLVRLAVDLRLILLLVAMGVALLQGAGRQVLLLMLAASYLGIGLLLFWEHIAAALIRRPALFLADVAITIAILVTAGVDGPFVLYTISTAFLAGTLYGYTGGTVFGVGLAVAHLVVASGRAVNGAAGADSFVVLIGVPTLTVLAGVGAGALRVLLLHAADVEADLDDAVHQTAAAEERARLAREMHDTLGKTLHGIALSAAALPRWVEKRPDQAAERAAQVATAAETAALEARQLISDLRSDSLDAPLHQAVATWAREWSESSGISCALALSSVGAISASSRYELFTILRESLRNVAAHAQASHVSVYLAVDGGMAVLEVADDGRGLRCTDLEQLAADGHYGLVGMRERARRAGGTLAIRSAGPGTTIRATVPLTSAHDMVRDGEAQ